MWQRWNQSSHIFEKSDDNGAIWTPLPLSGAIITEGTIPGVAYTGRENFFTTRQWISYSAPQVFFQDTSQPVDYQIFDIINASQYLQFRSLAQNGAPQASSLVLNRAGDAFIGRDIYEKGRPIPIGHWTHDSFAPYSQQGMTGTYSWSMVGKALHIVLYGSGTGAGGITVSRFNLPGGYVAAVTVATPCNVNCGSWEAGLCLAQAGQTYFDIYRNGAVAYPPGVVATVGISFIIPVG